MANVRAAGGGRKTGKTNRNLSAPQSQQITAIDPPPECRDNVATEMWQMTAPILIERGVLTLADATTLLIYCNSFSLYLQAEKAITATGLTVSSAQGGDKKNPAINARQDALATLLRVGSLLGLDPLSRTRVGNGGGGSDTPQGNKFAEFN